MHTASHLGSEELKMSKTRKIFFFIYDTSLRQSADREVEDTYIYGT